MRKIAQIFVCFSEGPNFNLHECLIGKKLPGLNYSDFKNTPLESTLNILKPKKKSANIHYIL